MINVPERVVVVFSHQHVNAMHRHHQTVANIALAHASNTVRATHRIVRRTHWISVTSNVPTWTTTISTFKGWVRMWNGYPNMVNRRTTNANCIVASSSPTIIFCSATKWRMARPAATTVSINAWMAFVVRPAVTINWIQRPNRISVAYAMVRIQRAWILSAFSNRVKLKRAKSTAKRHITISWRPFPREHRMWKFCSPAIQTIWIISVRIESVHSIVWMNSKVFDFDSIVALMDDQGEYILNGYNVVSVCIVVADRFRLILIFPFASRSHNILEHFRMAASHSNTPARIRRWNEWIQHSHVVWSVISRSK